MIFWIVAAALALITVGLFALALMRRPDNDQHPANYDLQVYRDQLKEVDKDLARGVIGEEDAVRMRTEISRRILAADAQIQSTDQGKTGGAKGSTMLIVLLAAVVFAGSFGLYTQLGAPGYRDMPLKLRVEEANLRKDTRMSQAEAEEKADLPAPTEQPGEEFVELMEKLRAAVTQNPDDLQGQELLVRNEANLGNLPAAYTAQGKVIEIKGDDVTAGDYVLHANLLITAAADYVSPTAEKSLKAALEIDPYNNLGRYYWGLMMWQSGRPDATYRIWDQVLRQSPPDAPWVPSIRATITELAWYAGVDYKLPAPMPDHSEGLSGPSAEDMQAADELSADDRQAMIQGMVDQLSERLATEGGTPQEWARLIGAYGVMGETDRATMIWEEAQQVFAEVPEALQIVRAGAIQAGLVQ